MYARALHLPSDVSSQTSDDDIRKGVIAFASTFEVEPEAMVDLMLETPDLMHLVGGETSRDALVALKEDPAEWGVHIPTVNHR